ncbi:hypothetical protein TRIATDRAFT_259219 [Trichoderma atroviride IMI 206040]|uniref:Uncharacterized protein n=1 Tax=Hypocrea atroviridis (strain ATCC 20476 / IMI 206040) TaxID=452589 RepID=G9P536_HYPAI|nr:uncharacterized protein TRIATDRAFT_259219 [Trichoderma atroviride IMI 206040]EHK41277.1 hypothetical protein TRIATDRAFT_259219 [Trichoderma atroviride IMI 206040]
MACSAALRHQQKEACGDDEERCYMMSNVKKRRAMEREYVHGHAKRVVQSGTLLAVLADR